MNAGLSFWTNQEIKLVANTSFIQGDGSRQSFATVKIIWVNVNPDARFIQPSTLINKEADFGFQIDMQNIPEY